MNKYHGIMKVIKIKCYHLMSLTNVIFLLLGVATGQEMDRGKKFFNVREK